MNYKLFYEKSLEYLTQKYKEFIDKNNKKASLSELEEYFYPETGSNQNKVTNLNVVFERMLFHAQNATMKTGVINFPANYNKIKNIVCDFDYKVVLNKYKTVDALRDKINKEFIIHNPNNSKNAIPYKYAKSILSCAKFLTRYNTLEEMLNHFLSLGDMLPVYLCFELDGFAIALACDFVKELDSRFDFIKPDGHIKAIATDLGLVDYMADSNNFSYKVMVKFKEIAEQIHITKYKLDKVLWLICTEEFYMHGAKKNNTDEKRQAYIKYIKDELGMN